MSGATWDCNTYFEVWAPMIASLGHTKLNTMNRCMLIECNALLLLISFLFTDNTATPKYLLSWIHYCRILNWVKVLQCCIVLASEWDNFDFENQRYFWRWSEDDLEWSRLSHIEILTFWHFWNFRILKWSFWNPWEFLWRFLGILFLRFKKNQLQLFWVGSKVNNSI